MLSFALGSHGAGLLKSHDLAEGKRPKIPKRHNNPHNLF